MEAEIAEILAPRWVARVVATTVTGQEPAELRLGFRTDHHARAELEEELFGKRILFTDKTKEQATTATIVADYRSQEAVEGDFRQMKDPAVVSFSPMFHFTEYKIRVHVFYCVLALMVARLMIREAEHAGLHLSVRELLGPWPASKRRCCSTKVSGAGPGPGACSPRPTPPSAASTTCSDSTPTPRGDELGTTAEHREQRRQWDNLKWS